MKHRQLSDPAAPAFMVGILVITIHACGGDGRKDDPVYDASCNDIARVVQAQCVVDSDQPCAVYQQAYEACRAEVKAGRDVRWKYGHFVPGEKKDPEPEPTP